MPQEFLDPVFEMTRYDHEAFETMLVQDGYLTLQDGFTIDHGHTFWRALRQGKQTASCSCGQKERCGDLLFRLYVIQEISFPSLCINTRRPVIYELCTSVSVERFAITLPSDAGRMRVNAHG